LIGAIKLRARILAIENIRTQDNVVAFDKIACNEQEKSPRVLRALDQRFTHYVYVLKNQQGVPLGILYTLQINLVG
jgi:hypothetical protein